RFQPGTRETNQPLAYNSRRKSIGCEDARGHTQRTPYGRRDPSGNVDLLAQPFPIVAATVFHTAQYREFALRVLPAKLRRMLQAIERRLPVLWKPDTGCDENREQMCSFAIAGLRRTIGRGQPLATPLRAVNQKMLS